MAQVSPSTRDTTAFKNIVGDDIKAESGFTDRLGNFVGYTVVTVDAAQWRNEATGVTLDLTIPAGSIINKVTWVPGSANQSRSINIGTPDDTDKFVDNQSMGTGTTPVDLSLTPAALEITEDSEIAFAISSNNGAQRGVIKIEFGPVEKVLAVD